MANDDMELVRDYAVHGSEPAFETLVTRYINLVYSSAIRQLRDPHLAEEITQVVFILLARKAGKLGPRTILPSWLHRAACFVAADALKIQWRRAQREQEAYMQSLLNGPENEAWPHISPLLDLAINGLNEKDRHVIVLRYFQDKSLKEIGAAMGISEEATKKRVNRAVEKLQKFLLRHGVNSTAAIITGAISKNSVQAAPVALAKSITAGAVAKGTAASASTLTLMKGALKLMAWTKAKTAMVAGLAVILAVGTATTVIIHAQPRADFPRASWKFAGYGDPVSALETYFWATSQGDAKTILASTSPDLQKADEKADAEMLQKLGMTFDEFVSRFYASDVGDVEGFQILNSEVVRVPKGWSPGTVKLTDYQNLHPDAGWDDQVRLHLSITGKPGEQVFVMKKIGNDWKVDDEPRHWDAPIARQLVQQHPELFHEPAP